VAGEALVRPVVDDALEVVRVRRPRVPGEGFRGGFRVAVQVERRDPARLEGAAEKQVGKAGLLIDREASRANAADASVAREVDGRPGGAQHARQVEDLDRAVPGEHVQVIVEGVLRDHEA
jgi:hypothetical protein